jgi:hypothetical protein
MSHDAFSLADHAARGIGAARPVTMMFAMIITTARADG